MVVDQKYIKLLEMIADKVGKDDLMFNGFESTYGHLQLWPPRMLYAHGDFRTIHVGWLPPAGYTNTSHYLIQVSDDGKDWRGLGFDGEWGLQLGSLTTVYSNTIAHTRIPFTDGSITTLFYRTALVAKDGKTSDWSEPISGHTYFIEAGDIRASEYTWVSSSIIKMDSNFTTGQLSYVASGSIGVFSSGAAYGYFDYLSYSSDSIIDVSSSSTYGQFITIEKTITGKPKLTASTLREKTYNYYDIYNKPDGFGSISFVTDEGTTVVPDGSTWRYFGQLTSQMTSLEAAGFITITAGSL